MMGTENVYVAPMQQLEQDNVWGVASTPAPRPYLHHPSNSFETLKKRYRAAKARVIDFVEANSGILLVMLAQTFSCLMYLAVKVLNQLDTPVPPLEVSTNTAWSHSSCLQLSGHCYSHGDNLHLLWCTWSS